MEHVEKFKAALNKYPILQTLEEKTNVPKEAAVLGLGALFLIMVLFGVGMGLVCDLLGFIPPMYCSIKAIETPGTNDDQLWLTYWVVYATFSIIEVFLRVLLYWIPFYYAFKVAFLLWCMHPTWRGAEFMYLHFIKDALSPVMPPPPPTATQEAASKAGLKTN
eukprot:FR740454.1.p1 GENE.FR740454.1~~FR740454.1.p1  ORF type:complete len:163 (+),score=21.64 FR740454.1:70-558(+)